MSKRDLPDAYICPTLRPKDKGIYIRKILIAHIISNIFH